MRENPFIYKFDIKEVPELRQIYKDMLDKIAKCPYIGKNDLIGIFETLSDPNRYDSDAKFYANCNFWKNNYAYSKEYRNFKVDFSFSPRNKVYPKDIAIARFKNNFYSFFEKDKPDFFKFRSNNYIEHLCREHNVYKILLYRPTSGEIEFYFYDLNHFKGDHNYTSYIDDLIPFNFGYHNAAYQYGASNNRNYLRWPSKNIECSDEEKEKIVRIFIETYIRPYIESFTEYIISKYTRAYEFEASKKMNDESSMRNTLGI